MYARQKHEKSSNHSSQASRVVRQELKHEKHKTKIAIRIEIVNLNRDNAFRTSRNIER